MWQGGIKYKVSPIYEGSWSWLGENQWENWGRVQEGKSFKIFTI